MEKLREECGVFGVYAKDNYDIAATTYYGLYALQHRGQESCGIAVCNDGIITAHKDLGLVADVFTPAVMTLDRVFRQSRATWPSAMCATVPPAPPTGTMLSPL